MEKIKSLLTQSIQDLFGLQTEVEVTPAPETATFQDGRPVDYACNVAMRLAGQLKKSADHNPTTPTKAPEKPPTPLDIATSLRQTFLRLAPSTPLAGIEVEIAPPGFLNFISPDVYLTTQLATFSPEYSGNISPDEYLATFAPPTPTTYHSQTVICEFSDPNPFKVLHVGHLYTSIVGDAISRLISAAGGHVIRANFGGDVGLHVAKNMYALLRHREEAAILAPTDPTPLDKKAEFMASCYVEGTRAYEDSPAAHVEITSLNHLIYHLVQFAIDQGYLHGAEPLSDKQISTLTAEFIKSYQANSNSTPEAPDPSATPTPESPSPPTPARITTISHLYWQGRATSYAYFQSFYAQIGLAFDKFYPESTVAGLGVTVVNSQLAPSEASPAADNAPAELSPTLKPFLSENHHTYQRSSGAIIFPGENHGLHTRVFINQNGLPTYETKDVGLLFTKWSDYHFDRSIVITGGEQADYMKVVLTSIEQYAPTLVHHTTHLTHGIVKLPGSVKMSSRKGNFLKAVDVLNLISTTLAENYHSADPTISLAATKYALLKYKLGGNIIFDPQESVSMTGNSGPYLQYSAVRARKILEKVSENKATTGTNPTPENLTPAPNDTSTPGKSPSPVTTPTTSNTPYTPPATLTPPEKSLLKKLLLYPTVLTDATAHLAPHLLCTYLYDLAQAFSRFYEHTPVAGSPEQAFRAHLVATYLAILTHGLSLLGIDTPEEM